MQARPLPAAPFQSPHRSRHQDYNVGEPIGRGRWSTVYKARRKSTIEYFAVKSLDKCARGRVLTEVQAASPAAFVVEAAASTPRERRIRRHNILRKKVRRVCDQQAASALASGRRVRDLCLSQCSRASLTPRLASTAERQRGAPPTGRVPQQPAHLRSGTGPRCVTANERARAVAQPPGATWHPLASRSLLSRR